MHSPDPPSPPADIAGLAPAEAAARLARDGPNELPAAGRRGFFASLADVAREPMFLLLIACAAVYALLGEARDAAMLGIAVAAMIGISLVQARRTERALDALRELAAPRVTVVRAGQRLVVPARELVAGDVFAVAEGERVAADAVLRTGRNLSVDESALTGESVPVAKFPAAGDAGARPSPGNAEGGAWLFAGTLVTQGSGLAEAVATGRGTVLGGIGGALTAIAETPTPVQQETARLVRQAAVAGVAVSVLVALIFGWQRGDWLQGALAGLTLAMASLPEELPVVLTVFMAIGAWRMARAGVLARRMAAIEALGAVTVLCVDKTGTLTENRMAVAALHADGATLSLAADGSAPPEAFHRTLEYAMLAGHREAFDPMEQAILAAGRGRLAGSEHIHDDWTLVEEYPLTPALLAMSRAWRSPDGRDLVIAAKGAPEAVIDLCHLPAADADRIAAAAAAMAERGLRVLGVAAARVPGGGALPAGQHDVDFDFIGLVGLADPVRADVPAAIARCRAAGIRVVMITGDSPATALAIARDAGLDAAGGALTGAALEDLPADERAARVGAVNVYCRMAPAQKLALVDALQAAGGIVAMTGDGVNDAPALKAADVGIAMGRRGTDVAREAASLVLHDDRFGALVDTIAAGRRIFANLRKAFAFIVAAHLPIVGMALVPAALGWPLAFLPIHIMLFELIVDPACSIALEMEPAHERAMDEPPRPIGQRLFDRATFLLGLLQGGAALAAVLAVYAWALQAAPVEAARGAALATLVLATLLLLLAGRGRDEPLTAAIGRPNLAFRVIALVALGVLALLLAVPALHAVFHVAAPTPALAAASGVAIIALSAALAGINAWHRRAKPQH